MKKLFAFVAILLVLVGCGVEYHSKYSNYEHPFYKYKTHQCFVYLGNSNAAVPYVKIKNADTTYKMSMHFNLGNKLTNNSFIVITRNDSLSIYTKGGNVIKAKSDSTYVSNWITVSGVKSVFIQPTYSISKNDFYSLRKDTITTFSADYDDKKYFKVVPIKRQSSNYLVQPFNNLEKISKGMPVDTTTH